MKNSLVTLAFVIYFAGAASTPTILASPEPDSSYCLEIDGKILNATGAGKDACRVELICLNSVVDSAFVNSGKKKFRFFLKKNQYYTIKISMKDHLNKLICVDTKNADVPTDGDDLFYFSFETSLIDLNSAGKINKDYADFPVAILYFDPKHDEFSYNKAYTNNIKREMYLTSK